ncbi:plasmid transfer protein [Pedobacter miscanthi]|uniref:Plasmid transfer protein n=1 Tax=Pedobacter miscanthi TaxID=2259170 RepID=A0A366LDV4_9SPHI|nr:plasmid transfer protein [Pedobacter miscanthi]RBQ12046.1 plasmid transfer protein [Pedobacter miscanthi]
MEAKRFKVYKGLQRPLTYKGFKGRFIYWGLGILLFSLISGALLMAMLSMYVGAVLMISMIVSGFFWLGYRQKKGLYDKNKLWGIYLHRCKLQKIYRYVRQERI